MTQFFDKENLRDCCGELYKLGIKAKLYRLTSKLNEETQVSVRTPVGDTESATVKEIVAQGTNKSGIISSSSLSGGVTYYFFNSKHEVDHNGLKMAPCLYVDDIARLVETL